ncbi:hypothetical protein AB0I39_01460 [Kitasatospora purpeofusca]|uniref:hypothetical protein n=1 Tax=Kitasatospora purpeofusca TaxID=67352 RepID=UPI003409C62F
MPGFTYWAFLVLTLLALVFLERRQQPGLSPWHETVKDVLTDVLAVTIAHLPVSLIIQMAERLTH